MTNQSLRIGIVHPSVMGPGGAEYTILFGAEELKKAGHEVTLFLGQYDQRFCHTTVRVRELKNSWPKWIRSKWIDEIAFRIKFANELSTMDVLICHNFPAPIWVGEILRARGESNGVRPLAIWYCHEPRRDMYPHITESHIMDIENFCPEKFQAENQIFFNLKERLKKRARAPKIARNRKKEHSALKFFDLILCNSHYTCGMVRQIYDCPAEVSYPPPPLPQNFLETSGLGVKKFADTIGLVAAFPERKNLANSIRALIAAKKRNPQLKVLVACPNPDRFNSWFGDLFRDIDPQDYFEVMNTAAREDLIRFYSQIHLLLYVPVNEPLGLLPLEVARFGVPSLLSDHGGPAEIAKLGFGRITNPFDIDGIVEHLVDWYKSGWPEISNDSLPALVLRNFPKDLIVKDIERAVERFRKS